MLLSSFCAFFFATLCTESHVARDDAIGHSSFTWLPRNLPRKFSPFSGQARISPFINRSAWLIARNISGAAMHTYVPDSHERTVHIRICGRGGRHRVWRKVSLLLFEAESPWRDLANYFETVTVRTLSNASEFRGVHLASYYSTEMDYRNFHLRSWIFLCALYLLIYTRGINQIIYHNFHVKRCYFLVY